MLGEVGTIIHRAACRLAACQFAHPHDTVDGDAPLRALVDQLDDLARRIDARRVELGATTPVERATAAAAVSGRTCLCGAPAAIQQRLPGRPAPVWVCATHRRSDL